MSGVVSPFLPGGAGAAYQPRFGKYRGKVLVNIDPEECGRIVAEVAAFPGQPESLGWCMPSVPYAGSGVGFYAIPPIGANVWIEYEGGDPNYPIWSGCFWAPGELPLSPEGPLTPEVKMWKTESIRLALMDTPEVGGVLLNVNPPCVATPLFQQFNSTGVQINAEPAILRMVVEEGIFLTFPPTEISLTAELLEASIAENSLSMTEVITELESPDISLTSEAAIELEAAGAITIAAAGLVDLSAGADIAIDAIGAIEVTAAMDVTIAAIASVNVTGVSIELTGVVTIDGMPAAVIPI